MKEESKELTPVEWLFTQIPDEWSSSKSAYDTLQQAKAMELDYMTEQQFIEKFKASGLELFESAKVHEAYERLEENENFVNELNKIAAGKESDVATIGEFVLDYFDLWQ